MPQSVGQTSAVPVVSARRVRAESQRVAVPVPDHEGCDEPRIELVRDADGVRAIDVFCPCGRHLRILCDFSPDPSQE